MSTVQDTSPCHVRHLADVTGGHCVGERCAVQRSTHQRTKFAGGPGPANGRHAVSHVHRRKNQRRRGLKQCQRQPVAHKVEDNEPTATSAHILNQGHEVIVRKMVRETDTDRDVGLRQFVARGVGRQDRHRRVCRRSQINADDLHAQRRANVGEHRAMTTPHIQHTPNGGAIPAERAEDRGTVAQEPVRPMEAAVGVFDDIGGQSSTVKNLRLKTPVHEIDVIGGGPAGAMAAIAALHAGARVRLLEKSTFPRHKVCGEFLSPAVLTMLERAECAGAFLALRPAVLRSMVLHFGSRVVRHPLPEEAYGLSRSALDQLLLDTAVARGADVIRESQTHKTSRRPVVLAHGRAVVDRGGQRLFGFKAHFQGPIDDDVSLFFFDGCYVGVSAVEGGAVNVCGLAPERLLQECCFRPEHLLSRCDALQTRMTGFQQSFDWLITGPLVTGWAPIDTSESRVYPAGDALGFIDPFTGSGILNAISSGRSAGTAAATGQPVPAYIAERRRVLRRPFFVSAVCRAAIAAGLGGPIASLVPGRWLFHMTRPAL